MLPGWENFAVISGSAAGALTGLLFVAVSLNRDRIVGHAALRSEPDRRSCCSSSRCFCRCC